jgi:nucleoid-associated protein YgaU
MPNEKGKADFSNVKATTTSTAPVAPKADFSNVKATVASSAPSAVPAAQSYTVVKGDSLSKIAKKFYGNANRWKLIHEANRDLIPNPDLIKPGQVLAIPADPKAKP